MNLYLDDSGTRNPDRVPGQVPKHGYDWFGIGGVMLRDKDEDVFRAAHAAYARNGRSLVRFTRRKFVRRWTDSVGCARCLPTSTRSS